jgi:YHS domain-containing protein
LVAIGLVAAGCSMAAPWGGMGGCGGSSHGHDGHGTARSVAESAVCPVCGTRLTVSEATPRATYDKRLYYFASEEHERRFLADPDHYLVDPTMRAPVAEPESTGAHPH